MTLQAKDLRLKNLLSYAGQTVYVMGIRQSTHYMIPSHNIELGYFTDSVGFERRENDPDLAPIALTSEWLERAGGYLEKGNAWWTIPLPDNEELGVTSHLRYCKGICFVEQILHQGFTQSKAAKIITHHEAKHGPIEDDDKFGMAMRKNSIQIERSIRYVHDFQNVWHSLTGTELTLKEARDGREIHKGEQRP